MQIPTLWRRQVKMYNYYTGIWIALRIKCETELQKNVCYAEEWLKKLVYWQSLCVFALMCAGYLYPQLNSTTPSFSASAAAPLRGFNHSVGGQWHNHSTTSCPKSPFTDWVGGQVWWSGGGDGECGLERTSTSLYPTLQCFCDYAD